MQVILKKDVENLGKANEVVEVKPGYGRNYLIPQGFALIANKRNLAQLEDVLKVQRAKQAEMLADSKAIADKIAGQTLKIGAKAGTSGKIFGSVTNIQLAEALESQLSITVDRKAINLLEEVKELGNYTAEIVLHPEVTAKVSFEVIEDK